MQLSFQTNLIKKKIIFVFLLLMINFAIGSTNTKLLNSFFSQMLEEENNSNITLSENNENELLETDLNENEKLFHLINDTRYDSPITPLWNRDLAIAYRDLAGLAYVSNSSASLQLNEIAKKNEKNIHKIGFFFRKFFEIGDWEHITTFTGNKTTNYFSYTIIRNKRIGKLICGFSGTKGIKQLFTEYLESGLETFFDKTTINNKNKTNNQFSYIKIMKYFNFIYKSFYQQFTEDLKKSLSNEINQYIFLGHSLGGAMASIFLYHSIYYNIISLQNNESGILSPVLITYGQPRTGNYVFANELVKTIPIVFRHANNYDVIVNMPKCYKNNSELCSNEYSMFNLDKNFSDYNNIKIEEKIYKTHDFPWHLNGLILNVDDDNSEECLNTSEASNHFEVISNHDSKSPCLVESKMKMAFHTHYYGYKVADLFKPEIFRYRLTDITCSFEDLFDFNINIPLLSEIDKLKNYIVGKRKDKLIKKPMEINSFLRSDIEESYQNQNLYRNGNIICYYLLKMFRFLGNFE